MYQTAATQLARIMWVLCEQSPDGTLLYLHASENNLDAPCDMLARLGVMKELRQVQHVFVRAWSPFTEVPLIRHAGEPTLDDLVLGLAFYTEWFPEEAKQRNASPVTPFGLDIGDRTKITPASERYLIWAVQGACDVLIKLNAGGWQPNGIFLPKGDPDIETYWATCRTRAQQLGDEKLLYPDLS
jgi:hypothetical protein